MPSITRDPERRGAPRIQTGRSPGSRIMATGLPSRFQWRRRLSLPVHSDEFARDSHPLPFSPDMRPAPAVKYKIVHPHHITIPHISQVGDRRSSRFNTLGKGREHGMECQRAVKKIRGGIQGGLQEGIWGMRGEVTIHRVIGLLGHRHCLTERLTTAPASVRVAGSWGQRATF